MTDVEFDTRITALEDPTNGKLSVYIISYNKSSALKLSHFDL